jgi:hypothetical protein
VDYIKGLKPPCSLNRRFAPAFAEAASRRQAGAFLSGLPMFVWSKFMQCVGSDIRLKNTMSETSAV